VTSALVHHERYSLLKSGEVSELFDLALSILKYKGFDPQRSRLKFLYGELFIILSQIYRRAGDQWNASWIQLMSTRYITDKTSQEYSRLVLGSAIRALRLGNIATAIAKFKDAESCNLPYRQKMRARIGNICALRLSHDHDPCGRLISETLNHEKINDRERSEILWQYMCLNAQSSQDISEIVKSVGPKGSHYFAEYYLEAYLWTRTVENRLWEEKLAKLNSMARSRSLAVHKIGYFYRCAQVIDDAYNMEIPYEIRLKQLGTILGQRHMLITIDKELLFLAAAARWLSRSHNFNMASMILNEYKSLCLRISSGLSEDVLCVLGNLFDKSWFR